MNTAGPAMSFFTSCCDFRQKEQNRVRESMAVSAEGFVFKGIPMSRSS
jgi:hypothetical protein